MLYDKERKGFLSESKTLRILPYRLRLTYKGAAIVPVPN